MVLFQNKTTLVVRIVIHNKGYRSRNCAVYMCERAFAATNNMILAIRGLYSRARHSVNGVHTGSTPADKFEC